MVDALYDVVGGKVFERCIHVMAGGGRMLVVGFTGGAIQSIPANLLLVKGISVLGVRAGADIQLQPQWAMEMNQQMKELTSGEEGRMLAPVIDSQVTAENFASAYRRVASRSVIGKAVVAWKTETMQQRHTTVSPHNDAGATQQMATLAKL